MEYYFGARKPKAKPKPKPDKLVGVYNGKKVYKNTRGRYQLTNGKKKYLKKGTRLTSTESKGKKLVKTKDNKVVGKRLSARTVYNKDGEKAIGKKFNILQKNGTYKVKVLKLRKNGSPYFANKFGNHVSFPLDLQLRGPEMESLTGYRNTWPNHPYHIAPGGVPQPGKMRLLPKGVHTRLNSFGSQTVCAGCGMRQPMPPSRFNSFGSHVMCFG